MNYDLKVNLPVQAPSFDNIIFLIIYPVFTKGLSKHDGSRFQFKET